MQFERTFDYTWVRRVIADPTQYKCSGDDSTPPVEQFRVNEDPRIWYVRASLSGSVAGRGIALFTFIPQNAVCFEVHANVLPEAWGRTSVGLLKGAISWIFAHSDCRRVVASVPACNSLAVRLARSARMIEYGVNERSFLKHGALCSQYLFGVSKEQSTCQV